jgi:hypothetical protein
MRLLLMERGRKVPDVTRASAGDPSRATEQLGLRL